MPIKEEHGLRGTCLRRHRDVAREAAACRRRVQFGPPSDAPEPVVEKVKLNAKPRSPSARRSKPIRSTSPRRGSCGIGISNNSMREMVLPAGKYEVSAPQLADAARADLKALPPAA